LCGIAGFVGKSKNLKLSFSILSSLFRKIESRGIDAAGYWMSEFGNDGKVHYHKQPGRSTELVKSENWLSKSILDTNLALVHARGASKGSGSPSKNINNHPFVSESYNLAVVHNGKVNNEDYESLIKKYTVDSQCDSEIILRIFEQAALLYNSSELDSYVGSVPEQHRLAGIKDVFSLINSGHMAVGIGEWKPKNSRNLWLFRNIHRPLWVADLREILGQVFFFSEPSIWKDSIRDSGLIELHKTKIVEIPNDEVWHFNIDSHTQYADVPRRYLVSRSVSKLWNHQGGKLPMIVDDVYIETITTLTNKNNFAPNIDNLELVLARLEKQVKSAQEISRNIYTTCELMIQSGSMTRDEVEKVIQILKNQNDTLLNADTIFG